MKYEKLLEKYIQNRLTSEEKLVFNELLKNDEDFRREVLLHTDIKKAVTYEDDIKFKGLVSNLENKSKNRDLKRSYGKWLIAASIALLLGLSYFININNKVTGNELFASYFVPYRNVIAPLERGSETIQQSEQFLAFMAYEKGEYKNAIALFTKLYTTTKEPYYLFYKANALLKLERANEAIPLLLKHLKTKDTLTDRTNWYLALAYLKIKENQKAKEILNVVISKGAYKNKEAKLLLKKIE
ncbi:MAG: CDC27 family protein [Cellulophaga sp.]